MRLQDKVAIITGGASGIGRATALKFAREGAKVVIGDFNEAQGTETVRLIQEQGGEAAFFQTDVTEFEQVENLVQFTVDTFGTITTIFNNAGIAYAKSFLDHDPKDFDRVLKVNLYGVYYGVLAAGRKMKELGVSGVIINNASVFGFMGTPGITGYQAAKGGVVTLTKHAAVELAPHGIRVVAVGPAAVDTPILQGNKDAGLTKFMEYQQLTKKLIQPEQVANVVAFMASDEGDSINGTTVMSDDGYSVFKSHLR
ncbi:SDR family NAD(P)-dependent oxidoreductase [Priestia koreensis]|uniref:Short-chain dehydrogenase n=1 Tax=Priestia koreensis TaxID=284581 RepID=A0A0M0KXB9_9BACI|nr:SDR family oxidoreductase [Priestia koreensis]KOO43456.1 short-chain dehydrogenase [Priestia koreensis]